MLQHHKMLARVVSATLAGALFVSVPAAAQEAHGVIAFGYTGERPGVAYGFAWNFPAKNAAHAEAMNACISGGGTDCAQVAWFQDACGALAMDQHGTAQGKPGMTQEQAEARALQGCESAGGVGCNIVGSVCTAPDDLPGTYSGSEGVLPAQVAQTTVTEPADESLAREETAPLQDAQTAVTGPVDELPVSEDRALIQNALNALGFDAGPADGVFGPRTLAAIYYWQRDSGHETTGQLTREQAAALIAQAASLAAAEDSPDQDEKSPPIPDADETPKEQQEAAGAQDAAQCVSIYDEDDPVTEGRYWGLENTCNYDITVYWCRIESEYTNELDEEGYVDIADKMVGVCGETTFNYYHEIYRLHPSWKTNTNVPRYFGIWVAACRGYVPFTNFNADDKGNYTCGSDPTKSKGIGVYYSDSWR